ncbi:MAG: SH3 domain-containing protein [Chloroflexota bacterium]
MGYVIGPDVSFYQDEPSTPQGIDFVKMRQNAEFVIIRAGQNLWVDSDFKANWAAAKKAGLPRGAYWFYDSRADPKRQAELWVEQFEGDFGELPLFADFEESYNGPYKGWRKWYDFLERLKQLVGQKEIFIYTAYYYWRDNAPNATSDPQSLEYFHQYPLWIANYGATKPSVPKPWGENEWLFWQYTETGDGKLYGVESKGIDLNYFNGDKAAFLARFKLSPPAEERFRVDLNVRQEANSNAASLGTLKHDDVVKKLETTADGEWVKILRDGDNLTGWSLGNYLVSIGSVTPPDDGDGDDNGDDGGGDDGGNGNGSGNEIIDMTGKWYRVTATALNMRAGPGTTYDKVGSLQMNEVVEALHALADLSWIEVRHPNGLTGWCTSDYLASASAPSTEPEHTRIWYRVNAASLNVREGPGANYNSLGFLKKDEIVYSQDITPDENWVKVRRFDGLGGWCSITYLTRLGENAPSQLAQRIFPGVTYYRKEAQTPRKFVTHVLAIDMRSNGLQFLVTPPSHSNGTVCTRTTSKFLAEFGMRIAINGDGFDYLDPATYNPDDYCPNGGDPVKVKSYAASRGNVYSARLPGRPILYINANNVVSFDTPSGKVHNAISGDRMMVLKGKAVSGLDNTTLEPRTAVGLNQNGRWMMLVVVDGRQPGYSEGVTFAELANLMIPLSIYTGINLDGGGSSTMVIEGADGKPFVINSPIDELQAGKERAVANHLGIYLKK